MKQAIMVGTWIAAELWTPAEASSACAPTPRETEGPFYPLKLPLDRDNNLTFVHSPSNRAQGEVIAVQGVVQDEQCRVIPGARVEIWQACASGRYNHPQDSNPAALDPHFQYWGHTTANDKGEYGFKTIKPGSYPASWFWTRPPHIHFKAHARGYADLTTQMYFAGEPLNENDRLFREHSRAEQEQCVVSFHSVQNERIGRFNLTLKKI